MCKELNRDNQNAGGTQFPVPTNEVNIPDVQTSRLEELFAATSQNPTSTKNILTLDDDDHKKSLSQDMLTIRN